MLHADLDCAGNSAESSGDPETIASRTSGCGSCFVEIRTTYRVGMLVDSTVAVTAIV